MRIGNGNIDYHLGNCDFQVAYLSVKPYGDTSVLCRTWAGVAESKHNTAIPDESIEEAWN